MGSPRSASAELRELREERDRLKARLAEVEHHATRDPAMERQAAAAILAQLPRSIRNRVVVIVSTLPSGELCASATLDGITITVPQHNLRACAFALMAGGFIAARLFAFDTAASIPPRGGRP